MLCYFYAELYRIFRGINFAKFFPRKKYGATFKCHNSQIWCSITENVRTHQRVRRKSEMVKNCITKKNATAIE